MVITIQHMEKLSRSVGEVEDPRRQKKGNIRHKLVDIIVLAFTAVLCGMDDYEEIEYFGKEKINWFKQFLELPNGIPDAITFYRVLARIDPARLAGSLQGWLFEVKLEAGFLVNIDGKTMRGSMGAGIKGVHIVSAWAGEQNLTLGQVKTGEHSNEITAIPELLDTVDIKGGRVTIDAMGCQKAIAAKVVEKGADYVLAVKENQPELYGQIRDFFEWTEQDKHADIAVEKWESGSEKDHGRIERRKCFTTDEVDWLYSKSEWSNIKSIIKYRCHCVKKDQTGENWLPETVYDRYYISSMDLGAEEMCGIIRKHWGIENNLHWMLDVAFGEDADQKKTGHAPANMNILRKAALSRISAHKSRKKESVKRCKLKALMHDDYRLSLLFDP